MKHLYPGESPRSVTASRPAVVQHAPESISRARNRSGTLALASAAVLLAACAVRADTPTGGDPAPIDPLLAQSRSLVADFEGRLKAQLQSAMKAGGPVEAISVCRDVAPQIAADLSRESGAAIGRVSKRLRNPGNMAETWQSDVLSSFAESRHNGESVTEYFERSDGRTRYAKAIHMGPLCLACHGSTLAPDVSAALAADYPHDRAAGYELGQLRGAFSVTWSEVDEDATAR